MILKSSDGYWTTGITVCWTAHSGSRDGVPTSGWYAHLDFLDDGFCDDSADRGEVSTQGRLSTRYAVRDGDTVTGLRAAIDALVADAGRLGIKFEGPAGPPSVYYDGDGENADVQPLAGWRDLLTEESRRLGWAAPYEAAVPVAQR